VQKQALQENGKQEIAPITHVATHEDLKTLAPEFNRLGHEAIAKGYICIYAAKSLFAL